MQSFASFAQICANAHARSGGIIPIPMLMAAFRLEVAAGSSELRAQTNPGTGAEDGVEMMRIGFFRVS